MKRQIRIVLMALAGCLYVSVTAALDFKNIGPNPVILYDAPGVRSQKLFVAPRGMPVEVILTYQGWSKIRDVAGDLTWLESKQLVERHTILVRSLNAKIRSAADESAEVVFSADKGVLLELIEIVNDGWVKVKHRDGVMGFVKESDVWGI